MPKRKASGPNNSGSRFDHTSVQRSGVPKIIRNEAVLPAYRAKISDPEIPPATSAQISEMLRGYADAQRAVAEPFAQISKSLIELSKAFTKVYSDVMHQLTERLAVVPTPEQLYLNDQKYFVHSSNWEFPTDGKAPFLRPDSSHRIALFESGYLACVPCQRVWCSHLDALLSDPESDANFFQNAFESCNKTGTVFFIPFEAASMWLPVTVSQLDSEQPVCKVVYKLVTKIGKRTEAEEINLGTITLGIEGYYSIALLAQNFLDERVVGIEECKASSHWKTGKDKQISTAVDAIGFILGRKCATCTSIAENSAGDDLIPSKEANWGARR